MRVLVLGGGQVARAVVASVSVGHEVEIRTHADLDITDESAVARVLAQVRADWVVNAAAYTAVDLAEDEPEKAWAVNDTAVASIVRIVRSNGGRLLHLSTDFVFDGESSHAYLPADHPNPLSVYGSSKLGGEQKVLSDGTGVVLRTSWVYAASGKNFVLTMLRLMREKDQISVVCDQIGAPTSATSVAAAIRALIETRVAPGIYHWTDLGVASWYDFAVAVQEEAIERGLLSRAIPICPISSSQYPSRAKRPPFSVLDSTATRSLLQARAAHWRQSLRMMLDELRDAG